MAKKIIYRLEAIKEDKVWVSFKYIDTETGLVEKTKYIIGEETKLDLEIINVYSTEGLDVNWGQYKNPKPIKE